MKVLKFSASWCHPCKVFKPIFDKVVKEVGIEHQEIDIDKDTELTQQYSIRSIPTIILLNDNNEIIKRESRGNMNEEELKKWLTE